VNKGLFREETTLREGYISIFYGNMDISWKDFLKHLVPIGLGLTAYRAETTLVKDVTDLQHEKWVEQQKKLESTFCFSIGGAL